MQNLPTILDIFSKQRTSDETRHHQQSRHRRAYGDIL